MGKPGIMKAKQIRRNKTPNETLTTSPAMIVSKNSTMQETVSDTHKYISKRTQKHSGIQNKENLVTNLLMEEDTRHWLMSRMNYEVS